MRKLRRLKAYHNLKHHYKKVSDFLNEDSILSWIANIALAFVLIKFIIYPFLGLIFATPYPIVAVVSGSMEHHGSFDDWWESPTLLNNGRSTQEEYYGKYGIDRNNFLMFPFSNGFNTGDIMVLRGADKENIDVGDIIVFRAREGEPIIHRVIEKNINGESVTFRTKGDNNPMSYDFESEIPYESVIGKAIFRIPYLGYVKIWFFGLIDLIMG
ncbi:MAG: signal peptidase I [bacterium]